jgi:hypothetical protein
VEDPNREGSPEVLDGGEQIDRAIRVAGTFSSGRADTSAHHDGYVSEAWFTSHEPEDR